MVLIIIKKVKSTHTLSTSKLSCKFLSKSKMLKLWYFKNKIEECISAKKTVSESLNFEKKFEFKNIIAMGKKFAYAT